MNMSRHTNEYVGWHVCMSDAPQILSHATQTNYSQVSFGMSHVTHMNESCHTYEWVVSHIWMRHVTNTNELCHTYERVISHVGMRHVTHRNVTWTTQWLCVRMRHIPMWHVICLAGNMHTHTQRLCERHIPMCDMTHTMVACACETHSYVSQSR